MADVKPPPQRQFVALGWLSLASCSSTEPACVLPTNTIVISSFIIVEVLFIMMLSFWLYVLLWRREFGISLGKDSFRSAFEFILWCDISQPGVAGTKQVLILKYGSNESGECFFHRPFLFTASPSYEGGEKRSRRKKQGRI